MELFTVMGAYGKLTVVCYTRIYLMSKLKTLTSLHIEFVLFYDSLLDDRTISEECEGKVAPVRHSIWFHEDVWGSGGECSASHPSLFTPGEGIASTRPIGGWVGSRTGLNAVTKMKAPFTLPPQEIDPRSTSPLPSHCTDWATPLSVWLQFLC
jgi:hypothetical protein